MFDNLKWLALQQPILLLVSMVTGKDIMSLLAMTVHDRMILLQMVIGEIHELVGAAAAATDPTSPGGVTLTEEEMGRIIDEANDIGPAVDALLGKANEA